MQRLVREVVVNHAAVQSACAPAEWGLAVRVVKGRASEKFFAAADA